MKLSYKCKDVFMSVFLIILLIMSIFAVIVTILSILFRQFLEFIIKKLKTYKPRIVFYRSKKNKDRNSALK